MATDREIALEVALIAVVKAAEKQGFDLKQLLDKAAEVISTFPEQDAEREARIAAACTEISDAHAAVLTGKRARSS